MNKNSEKTYRSRVRLIEVASSVSRPRVFARIVLLLGMTVIAYFPSLTGGFIWDDDYLLTKNELVKASDGLYRMWCTTEPHDYWPITNSMFWFEWRLWGMHQTGYHIANLILHIVSSLLIWAILRKLSIPVLSLHP